MKFRINMTREIKFRAWDKIKNIMFEVGGLSFTEKNRYITDNNEYIKRFENTELMQFTGLKDKNGKEVYEGDILESLSWSVASKKENKERMRIGGNIYNYQGGIIKNKKGEPYIIHEIKFDERKEFKGNKFGYYWTGEFTEVKFSSERGGFTPFATDKCCGCCAESVQNSAEVRVIGNVWENPNLIKQ